MDNFSTGRYKNISHLYGRINLIEDDLTIPRVCDEACKGVDTVFHLAALPSVPRSVKDPIKSNNNNVCSTVNLLKAAVDNGVKRFIYIASSSAYGDIVEPVKVETMCPNPKSPYAVSKLTGEYYLKAFSSTYGLDCVSLRLFNVIGSRQLPNSPYSGVVPRFIMAALKGEDLIINGSGEQSRDFTSVYNVVDACILAMKCGRKLNGEVINIACGQKITVNELAEMIEKIHGKELVTQRVPERIGDIKHSLADISLSKKILDYEPNHSLKEALREAYEYYKKEVEDGRS